MPDPLPSAHGPVRPPQAFGSPSREKQAEAERRAEAPRAPVLPPRLAREEAERQAQRIVREGAERRSVLRGLLLLALLVLVISLWRAGLDRVFPAGWWRQW